MVSPPVAEDKARARQLTVHAKCCSSPERHGAELFREVSGGESELLADTPATTGITMDETSIYFVTNASPGSLFEIAK